MSGFFNMSALKRIREFPRRLAGPPRRMKLVLICGTWGGGTSAVAGFMAMLGAQGFGPYHQTREPRTPVSFEFFAFRDTVLRFASEDTVELKTGTAEAALVDLQRLHRDIKRQKYGLHDPKGSTPILFKYPLSALLLPQICEVFDTRLIYVMRPLEDIEQSRLRRDWPRRYGRQGAEIIYRAMRDFEQLHSHPVFTVQYADFRDAPAAYAHELARFAGLEPSQAMRELAVSFVRSDDKPPLPAKPGT
jgi:hypothetical protein